MNKQQWKAEYSKWRAVIRNIPTWPHYNEKVWSSIFRVSFNVMSKDSHHSIRYAITRSSSLFSDYSTLVIGKPHLMQCNLQMTKEACETYRLKAKEAINE
jgi:hypothetical protein